MIDDCKSNEAATLMAHTLYPHRLREASSIARFDVSVAGHVFPPSLRD